MVRNSTRLIGGEGRREKPKRKGKWKRKLGAFNREKEKRVGRLDEKKEILRWLSGGIGTGVGVASSGVA